MASIVTHFVASNSGSIDFKPNAGVEDEKQHERDDVHDQQVHPVNVDFHVNLGKNSLKTYYLGVYF